MYYYLWDNIFLNLITWAGTDMLGTGLATSVAILYSFAWVSFIIIYLTTCPLYLIYAIMVGARNDVTTDPIELFKGIGVWAVSMPLTTIVLGIIYKLTTALDAGTASLMDAETLSMASNFSWILTLIVMIVITIVPFIFIVKAYGIKMMKEEGHV